MIWETRFVDDSLVAYARCAPPAAADDSMELLEEKVKPEEAPLLRRSMTDIEHRWLSREPVGSQTLEITPESPPSRDAEVLDSKFHFAYILMRKMLKSAERNWMLNEKHNFLKHQHGQTKDKTQKKLTLEQRMEETQQGLTSALGAFDNAKAGVVWLEKQYLLGLAMIKLKNELGLKHEESETLAGGNYSLKEIELKKTQIAKQIKHLEDSMISAEKQQRALQKESLDVGLKYLDANCSGSIEPEDVPTMTAELFNMLDINKNHAITPAELQEAVTKMEAHLDDLRARRASLKDAHTKLEQQHAGVDEKGSTKVKVSLKKEDVHERTEVEMAINEAQQSKLDQEIQQQQSVLQEVFRVFESAFTMNVFTKLQEWDALLALPKEGSPITCSMAAVARRPKMVERLLDAASVVTEEEEASIGVVGPSPLYRSSPSTPREVPSLKGSPTTGGEESRLARSPVRPPTPLQIASFDDVQPESAAFEPSPMGTAERSQSHAALGTAERSPSHVLSPTLPVIETPTGASKEKQYIEQGVGEFAAEKEEASEEGTASGKEPIRPTPTLI